MGKRKWYLVMGIVLSAWLGSTAQAQTPNGGTNWMDKITPIADFRYRHEEIDQELGDDLDDYYRVRDRIRARFGMQVRPTDDWSLTFRLASGVGEPNSRNQTLGSAWAGKSIWLDQAYMDYHPQALKGMSFRGGIMANPLFIPGKNQLVWDHDVNPEGLSLSYAPDLGNFVPFVTGFGYWVMERETTANDGILYGGQAGIKVKSDDGSVYFTGAGAYYDWTNTQDNLPYYASAGNSLDAAGNYLNAYEIAEGSAEFGFMAGKIPITLFGDYAVNNGISDKDQNDDDNVGWLGGIAIGKAQKQFTWSLGYQYRELQKDAVIGEFCDSDFGGGGTDNKGNIYTANFAVFNNVVLGFTWYDNTKYISPDDPEPNNLNYDRYQLDLIIWL